MIKMAKDEECKISGTPFEIICEITQVVKTLYSTTPEEFKPDIKKILLSLVNEVLCDDSVNNGKENDKQKEAGKHFPSEEDFICAGGEAFKNMFKKNPGIVVMMDEFLKFYADAMSIAFKKNKEEK